MRKDDKREMENKYDHRISEKGEGLAQCCIRDRKECSLSAAVYRLSSLRSP